MMVIKYLEHPGATEYTVVNCPSWGDGLAWLQKFFKSNWTSELAINYDLGFAFVIHGSQPTQFGKELLGSAIYLPPGEWTLCYEPTRPGYYWYWGDPHAGDFKFEERKSPSRLYVVQVKKIAGTQVCHVVDGSFINNNQLAYWMPAEVPVAPEQEEEE